MKALSILLVIFLSANIVQADERSQTISSLRKWKSAKVSHHKAWDKDACLSYTISREKNARLEIYAEKMENGQYAEPTIQVVITKSRFPKFFTGRFKIDNQSRYAYQMTLASSSDQVPGSKVALVRFSRRESIAELLRSKNSVLVQLYDAKKKRVAKMRFSLSGSSATIKKQFEACKLGFVKL